MHFRIMVMVVIMIRPPELKLCVWVGGKPSLEVPLQKWVQLPTLADDSQDSPPPATMVYWATTTRMAHHGLL